MSHGHDAHHDDHAVVKGSSGAPAGLKQTTSYSLGSPLIMDVKKGLWFGGIFSAGASLSACPQPSTPHFFFFSLGFLGRVALFRPALPLPALGHPAAQRPTVALAAKAEWYHACLFPTDLVPGRAWWAGVGLGAVGVRGVGFSENRDALLCHLLLGPRHTRARMPRRTRQASPRVMQIALLRAHARGIVGRGRACSPHPRRSRANGQGQGSLIIGRLTSATRCCSAAPLHPYPPCRYWCD
jgi:hypothetical protein